MTTQQKIITALIGIAVLGTVASISSYYLYILPGQNAERLAFGKQKYEEAQLAKIAEDTAKADEEWEKSNRLSYCLEQVDKQFKKDKAFLSNYVQTTCDSMEEGTYEYNSCYTVAGGSLDKAKATLKSDNDTCYKHNPL